MFQLQKFFKFVKKIKDAICNVAKLKITLFFFLDWFFNFKINLLSRLQ